MGFGEFMAFAVVVAGTVAVIRILADAYQRKLAVREREIELRLQRGTGSTDSGNDTTIARLEDRVRVLERIATDADAKHGQDVARQIEALRQERVLEESK